MHGDICSEEGNDKTARYVLCNEGQWLLFFKMPIISSVDNMALSKRGHWWHTIDII